MINEAGGTVQRVNAQLDKADRVTDSAVDIADSVDTAVRAVTIAITRPVQKVAGLAEGVAHAASSLRVAQEPAPRLRGRARGGPAARAGDRGRAARRWRERWR